MIVREIVERDPSSAAPTPPKPPAPSSQKHGFPAPRRRTAQAGPSRFAQTAQSSSSGSAGPSKPNPNVTERDGEQFPHLDFAQPFQDRLSQSDEMRRQMEEENNARVESMTEEEREQEREELLARFGGGLVGLMRKRKEQREKERTQPVSKASHTKAASSSGETTHADSSVPEEPVPAFRRAETVSPEDAKLAWTRSTPSDPSSTDSAVRFDLSGNVLSDEAKASLPTSAGLHHHGTSPDLAGYTIDDILWLSRSTVPSQRITMLSLLGRIIHNGHSGKFDDGIMQVLHAAQPRQKAVELTVDILLRPASSVGLVRVAVDVLYYALGGDMWKWRTDDHEESRYRPDPHPAGISAVPFDELAPRLQELLGPNSTLPDMSIVRLTRILYRAVIHTAELAEQIGPSIPAWVVGLVFAADQDPLKSVGALQLLFGTIEVSRSCAEAVVDAGIPTRLSRFLLPQTWPNGDPDARTFWALRILTSLGRYGLAASYVTSSTDIIRALGDCVQSQSGNTEPSDMARLVTMRYFQCLAVWTTCAIDPHNTTPEHALTWAQVSSMDWISEATTALKQIAEQEERDFEMVAALALCEAWVTGAIINGERGGEDELRAFVEAVQEAGLDAWPGTHGVRKGRDTDTDKVIEVMLRLDNTLAESSLGLHTLSLQTRRSLLEKWTTSSGTSARGLRYQAIRAGRRDGSLSQVKWSANALTLLRKFDTGDEPDALDLLDQLLKHDQGDPSDVDAIEHADKLQILRPLLQYAILPGAALVVGPSRPLHTYLKATTTLRRPALPEAGAKRSPGLPLPTDWTWSPLDVLLESASSPALAQAPPDWTPSEVDIVRASLILSRKAMNAEPLTRSTLLFDLMKVFMLEHNSQSAGVHVEIFRDESVAAQISALLATTTATTSTVGGSASSAPPETMEAASVPFLGPEVPFYSWYSDFITLYEAVSYGDTSFSQLALAPTAMHYPIDFRKLLWVEHATALRSIRTRLDQLPLEHGSLQAYFHPAEQDQDVLAGYLRALNAGWVTQRHEALFKIAVWHLGCFLWDKRAMWEEQAKEAVRKGLLGGLVQGASQVVLREVFRVDVGGAQIQEWRQVDEKEVKRRTGIVQHYLGDDARLNVARKISI